MCMPKSLPPFLNLLQFQEQAQKSANTPCQANTKVVFEEAYPLECKEAKSEAADKCEQS